jgi:transposase InsO family protein
VDDFSPLTAMAALTDGRPQPIHTWHKRLGHLAVSTIKKMASENMVDGLNIEKEVDQKFFCDGCAYGKAHRLSFPTGRNRAGRIGELIHSDLCGPMSCTSPSGAKYFKAFKDDYSGYVTINFLKNKSEAQQCFKYFAGRVEVETGNRIDTIRSDNGGEFFTTDFETWLKEKGIRQESSAPYTPEQNGVAERLNRTIVESARSMLHSAQVASYLWAEAVNCAVYLQNRSASKSIKNTPYEIWKGVKPNITHLRVFGSEVFVHVPKRRRENSTQKPSSVFTWATVNRRRPFGRGIRYEEKSSSPEM